MVILGSRLSRSTIDGRSSLHSPLIRPSSSAQAIYNRRRATPVAGLLVTQYQRGRAKEYRAIEMLRSEGWTVGRSAGSHSPVDIFAARAGKVLLVQVKSKRARLDNEELRELVKWARAFNADAEVWHFKGRGNLERRRISLDGQE